MKKRFFLAILLLVFGAEAAVLLLFAAQDTDDRQDVVLVNEILQSVQGDWGTMESHRDTTGLNYVVLDLGGAVLFRTRFGLSESINRAVSHRDTILDIQVGGAVVGKLLVYNESALIFQSRKRTLLTGLSVAVLGQWGVCIGYLFYINYILIKPFHKLKGFAECVARGNLDIPLEMDRKNIFGAFTESFDMMRSELKRARKAEAEADASKKELVAKLSHDIRTPVASIKAASEVGAALTDNEKIRENYMQIVRKTDQINTLVTNLFSAALEELKQLPVICVDLESRELESLLENADYLHRAAAPGIPVCVLRGDRLRLQQVFDNIFANSYKYANTKVDIEVYRERNRLAVRIEDYGGGVGEEEVAHLKEKFKRGRNAQGMEGAGLGLYISDYFLREMGGELAVKNGAEGLEVTVWIPLSGKI